MPTVRVRLPLAACVFVALVGCQPAREPRWGECGEGAVFDGEHCRLLSSQPPATVDPSAPLAGAWALTAVGDGGAVLTGQATFEPLGNAMYRVRYERAGISEEGVAIVYAGVVSVGIGGQDSGVAQYERTLIDGKTSLVGSWAFQGSGTRGLETLRGGNPDLSGVYAIGPAKGPDGADYGGTCDLVVTGDLHTLLWHVPGPGGTATYRGLGLLRGSLLSVGFSTGNAPFAVAQYTAEQSGKKLVGRRAAWVTTSPQAAQETLAR